MPGLRIDRLLLPCGDSILHGMENRNITASRFPTPGELYALEREARRMRSVILGRGFVAAVTALKDFFARAPQGVRHA